MKKVNGREQGTWDHPALYEVGKALKYCRLLDRGPSGPCSTSSYLKKEAWCEMCIANEALKELSVILKHAAKVSDCACSGCELLRKYLKNGAANEKRYGIHAGSEPKKA